jgi:hypothetical protein
MTLRIAYIGDAFLPARARDMLRDCVPDVVVGPEWVRGMCVGCVFVPRNKIKFLEWIKDAHVRETLGTGLVDEVRLE